MANEDNPFLDMGLMGMMAPNPYLDVSLNRNPDGSPKALKLPGFYTSGQTIPPTDAYGNPIARYGDEMAGANTAYQQQLAQYNAQRAAMTPTSAAPAQGTTMTSVPAGAYSNLGQWGPAVEELENNYLKTPAGAAANANPNAALIQSLQNQDQYITSSPQGNQGGYGSVNSGPLSGAQRDALVNNSTLISQLQKAGAAAPAAAGPVAPTPPNDRQAYLDALSSPGPLKKVGANVPASKPLGVPSVMDAFMAAHPSGGAKGAGGYDNSGFFTTLNQLGRTA